MSFHFSFSPFLHLLKPHLPFLCTSALLTLCVFPPSLQIPTPPFLCTALLPLFIPHRHQPTNQNGHSPYLSPFLSSSLTGFPYTSLSAFFSPPPPPASLDTSLSFTMRSLFPPVCMEHTPPPLLPPLPLTLRPPPCTHTYHSHQQTSLLYPYRGPYISRGPHSSY